MPGTCNAPVSGRRAAVPSRAGDEHPAYTTTRHASQPRAGADPGFRERIRALHRLGPRPLGEIIAEILARFPQAGAFALARLERYAVLDPDLVARFGGSDWIEARDTIRLVAGERP